MIRERRDNKGRLLLTGESQLKSGTYIYRFTDIDGRRKSISNVRLLPEDVGPAGTSKQECLREMEARIASNLERGFAAPLHDKFTLNDYWEKYLQTKYEVAESTLLGYIHLYNRHVRDSLGRRPITSIRYVDIKKYYMEKLEHGLNISSIANIHTLVSPIFALAVKQGDLVRNPAEGLLSELQHRKDWQVTHHIALTETEQAALMDYVSSRPEFHELHTMLTVFLGTGIRVGELTGLTWDDVDFAKNVIHVNKTLNYKETLYAKCTFYITFPKSNASIRDIPMLDEVRTTLTEMYRRRDDFNGEYQVRIDGFTNFVFRDLDGNVYSNHRVNYMLRKATNGYNREEQDRAVAENRQAHLLPSITCHHLRSTFCSTLLSHDIPIKTVQILMGHVNPSTTLSAYAFTTDEKNKEALYTLNGKLHL